MNISFSTIDKNEAVKRFSSEKYAYLTDAAKEYVLNNLGENGCRVQCLVMYPAPQVEFHGPDAEKHYKTVLGLLGISNKTAELAAELQKATT